MSSSGINLGLYFPDPDLLVFVNKRTKKLNYKSRNAYFLALIEEDKNGNVNFSGNKSRDILLEKLDLVIALLKERGISNEEVKKQIFEKVIASDLNIQGTGDEAVQQMIEGGIL